MNTFIDIAFWVVIVVVGLNLLGLVVALIVTGFVDWKRGRYEP